MATHSFGWRNKELLAITLLLNIAAVGWYIFLFAEIKGKNEHISNLVNEIDAEAKEENVLNSIKTLVVETSELRDKLSGYVIEKDSAVSFIELLESIGEGAGTVVTIDSVDKADIPGSSGMENLRLTLKATGSWASVIRFLGSLELLPYEARVEQVVLSKADAGNSWVISLSLVALKEK